MVLLNWIILFLKITIANLSLKIFFLDVEQVLTCFDHLIEINWLSIFIFINLVIVSFETKEGWVPLWEPRWRLIIIWRGNFVWVTLWDHAHRASASHDLLLANAAPRGHDRNSLVRTSIRIKFDGTFRFAGILRLFICRCDFIKRFYTDALPSRLVQLYLSCGSLYHWWLQGNSLARDALFRCHSITLVTFAKDARGVCLHRRLWKHWSSHLYLAMVLCLQLLCFLLQVGKVLPQ